MKKTLISLGCAFLLGGIFSFFAVTKLKEELNINFSQDKAVTAFQVGVYKSVDNAITTAEKYPGAIYLKDGEYYRVYIGVAAGKESEKYLEDRFIEQNLNVFPKEIKVTKTFYEELSQYEKLLKEADESVYDKLNGEILKKLQGEIL